MSNRVFKKVFGGDELKGTTPESEDEHPSFNSSRVVNPYALLNELSESEAKEDDGAGGGDGSEEPMEEETKKKRKKKKPAKKKKYQEGSGSDRALDTEMEEEIAAKQRQKVPNRACVAPKKNDAGDDAFERIFKLDPKFINSEFELKRIFGAKVINHERSKHGQRRILRHSRLVMPKEQWPSVAGSGISMSYLNTVDGALYFKFDHNSHYREVQKQFMIAVESMNPDNIVNILRLHPYHIDSQIQLSDVAKSAEDMQVAADLVEGAIHCLENAFHVRFSLLNASHRLDYKFQENRAFFILLFKHLVFVGLRACHRTALELCKRLLTLDPATDPLCATLMIDFYAIKAGEQSWLVDLYKYWEKSKNLDQLPNFAYSIALSYHLLSVNKSTHCEEYLQKADAMIQYAVLMFPSVLLPLLEKVGVQIDSRVRNHDYFNSFAKKSQTKSLRLLCELYVWRCFHLWREQSILPWLEKNVSAILDKVDKKDSIVKDYEEKRKRRYLATTPRNIFRHCLITECTELSISATPDIVKEPLLSFDPLPPHDSVDIYNFNELKQRQSNTRRAGVLNMLLNSLWNDLNAPQPPPANVPMEQGQEADQVENAAAVDQHAPIALAAGLQQSVTALLDAMRDLLTNANGRADAADGEDSATEEGEAQN